MTSKLNLVRRGGMYHFRRVIPPALRPRFGAGEYVRSLRTRDPKVAAVKSRALYVLLENCLNTLQNGSMLSKDKIAEIVSDFKSLALEIENGLRLSEPPISEEERQQLVETRASDILSVRADGGRGDFARAEFALRVMVKRRNLNLDEFEARQLGQALLLAGIDVMKVSAARLDGDFGDLVSAGSAEIAPVFTDRPHDPSGSPNARPAAFTPVPLVSSGPTVSVTAASFLEAQRRDKIWDEQTLRQAKKTFELLVEIVGDRPIADYTRPDAARFKTVLQDLPADYGKAAIFRGKPAPEIILVDAKRQPMFKRLDVRTVKRHLTALSALWRWAGSEGRELPAIFLNFSFPSAKRANEQREMWTTEDLQALFASPIWTGSKSIGRRMEPGMVIIRDDKFWLPLIALFSGMRQEEICQLHTEDVKKVDGYWVFDINARPPRKLKNRNAVRQVPVHSELVRLGLLEYANLQVKQGHKVLFPDLAPGGADGRLGHGYSKWFARYRQATKLYRRGLDFHSLRHTATTLLVRGDISRPIVDELTGHSTPGETSRYSHGVATRQLAEAIEAIRPLLDLSALYVVKNAP